MIMQRPQTHMVSRTNQASLLKVHNDDCEIANNPLERALVPMIKEPKRNHAVGHRMQVSGCKAKSLAQLRPVIDATIEQHDKSIGEEERLPFKDIFWR